MSRLIFISDQLSQLRQSILQYEAETCAILFARAISVSGRVARVIVRQVMHPEEKDYSERTGISAQLKPEFVAWVTKLAMKRGESIIFAHTHPMDFNDFSRIDDEGEQALKEFLDSRMPGVCHGALVLTPSASLARELGADVRWQVAEIGSSITWGDPEANNALVENFDRQVRAFGAVGQQRLQKMRIGIVGLGGTGSVVLQQLVHLGVADFVLLDPDLVERTNLNRLVGATPSDVGARKVEVAKRLALAVNPEAAVEALADSVLIAETARSLANVDFIFCCTDSHGSRAVLNQVAYQYVVPMIDMGVVLKAVDGTIEDIAARIQYLAPGISCLTCDNSLNSEQVRRDLMTDFERQQDPYIIGAAEPAPSVITLNSLAASFATTMFLSAALGVGSKPRFINYNGISGVAKAARSVPNPVCVVCSPRGALGRGDEWPLAARRS